MTFKTGRGKWSIWEYMMTVKSQHLWVTASLSFTHLHGKSYNASHTCSHNYLTNVKRISWVSVLVPWVVRWVTAAVIALAGYCCKAAFFLLHDMLMVWIRGSTSGINRILFSAWLRSVPRSSLLMLRLPTLTDACHHIPAYLNTEISLRQQVWNCSSRFFQRFNRYRRPTLHWS